jgi:hypothetical protein
MRYGVVCFMIDMSNGYDTAPQPKPEKSRKKHHFCTSSSPISARSTHQHPRNPHGLSATTTSGEKQLFIIKQEEIEGVPEIKSAQSVCRFL